MRYVLIVCHDFPWVSAAGVIRIYQFAKRLPDFGWQPIILTAQRCGIERDENIERSDGELPCPKFTATNWIPPRSSHANGFRSTEQLRIGTQERIKKTELWRLVAALAVPDGKICWWLPAVKQGLAIAARFPVRICLSTSPRPTAHLVARRLAGRLKIPWIADFALPWSDAHWLEGRPRLLESMDRRLEKVVVKSATQVTVAYPDIGRSLRAYHAQACENKITVIPTGFDEDLFAGQARAMPDKFTIVYPGNHFCEKGRNGEYFLRAIDEWVDMNPGLEGTIECVFIGKRDETLVRQRNAMAHRKVVRMEALMSHHHCIQAIVSSHLCVVNTVGNRIPAKVYECMRAGKWILALTEPGSDLEGITKHYSRSITVSPRDTAGLLNALESAYQRCRKNSCEPKPTEPFLQTQSSKCSTEALSRILSGLAERRDHLDAGNPS